jgi:ABC-type glycerol-3-phosphate transport system substrate-binding protein
MKKGVIAMLIALSFAAVSCGGTKEEAAATDTTAVEVDTTAVQVDTTATEVKVAEEVSL